MFLSPGPIAGGNACNFHFFVCYLTFDHSCLFIIFITLQSINHLMKITPLLRLVDTRNEMQCDSHL